MYAASPLAGAAVSAAGHRPDHLRRRTASRRRSLRHGGAPPQSLKEETVYYEESPPVQIISLSDLEPVDTQAAANPAWIAGGTPAPVDPAEMEVILAECTLQDGTIIRLYATAEGLIDGAFSRSGAGWIRFVRCCNGEGDPSAFVSNPTLTPFDGVLGKSGFLLRYAGAQGFYSHDYYWFDADGTLRMLHAWFDPVALDLDGDGTAELVWEIPERTSSLSFCCQDADGTVYQVQTGVYVGGFLEAVEAEGPGPVRLIFRRRDSETGLWQYHALTLRDGRWRWSGTSPTSPRRRRTPSPCRTPRRGGRPCPTCPSPAPTAGPWTAPERPPILTCTPSCGQPLPLPGRDGDRAHRRAPGRGHRLHVTFSDPETGASFSWSLDAEGVCRFDGIEGNCRLVSTSSGSLPAYCHDVLAIYCDASRTARNYDGQGRWLGWDLVEGWTP